MDEPLFLYSDNRLNVQLWQELKVDPTKKMLVIVPNFDAQHNHVVKYSKQQGECHHYERTGTIVFSQGGVLLLTVQTEHLRKQLAGQRFHTVHISHECQCTQDELCSYFWMVRK